MTAHDLPAAFFGHGSPMNALRQNRYTEAWRAFGAAVPRPRAILSVSAHWYVETTAVTAMRHPRTLHDFRGFPAALSEVYYHAPGLPELAAEVAEVARPDRVVADADSWGLDHGSWSVLRHAFPEADVPVVQLSIDSRRPPAWHFELGSRLAALRSRGVLIVASGNIVHNLRAIDWHQEDAGFDWARRFDEAAHEILATQPADVLRLHDHPDYAMAAPTPDHFLPLLYFAGIAAASGEAAQRLVAGFAYGSLSMASYAAGAPGMPRAETGVTDAA